MKLRLPRRRGNTLIEVVISSLLVGVVLVGAMNMIGGVFKTRRINAGRIDGPALAQELITEVLAANYEDPEALLPGFGHESEENQTPTQRLDFDDVDDYDDWTASPPQAKDGSAIAGYTGWTRTVTVEHVTALDPTVTLPDTTTTEGLKRVTVVVTDPQANSTTVVSLRGRWGAVEQPPAVDTTVVLSTGVQLQVGSTNPAIVSGTNLSNHAVDE